MHGFENKLSELTAYLAIDQELVKTYISDLQNSDLIKKIGSKVASVPEFSAAKFDDISSFHLYRTMLYVFVRAVQPGIFVETGVLNGFSSAFILQAMHDNDKGRLISIDLPSHDLSLLNQGTSPLPDGKNPGWAIPEDLIHRHDLRLGHAERLLPELFLSEESVDIFLHDSDHVYDHMMMEMSLAWKYLKSGFLLVDNIEQNEAFSNFAAGVSGNALVVKSYDSDKRRWLHGILEKRA